MPLEPPVGQRLLTFLQSQKLLTLATQEAETPYLSLMAYAVGEDLRQVFLATKQGTRKYENMRRNPAVALLIDDRCEKKGDFHDTMVVTGFGKAWEAEREEKGPLTALFLERHPELASIVHSPDGVIFKVVMERYLIIRRFEEAEELVLV